MKTISEVKKIDTLIESRIKDLDKVNKAVKKIKQLHRRCNGFNGVKEVRRWRER